MAPCFEYEFRFRIRNDSAVETSVLGASADSFWIRDIKVEEDMSEHHFEFHLRLSVRILHVRELVEDYRSKEAARTCMSSYNCSVRFQIDLNI